MLVATLHDVECLQSSRLACASPHQQGILRAALSLTKLLLSPAGDAGSCTVSLGRPPAAPVSALLPGCASISITSQPSLVSAPGKPQPPRAVATFQLPDGRTLELSPTGWVRLQSISPAVNDCCAVVCCVRIMVDVKRWRSKIVMAARLVA